MISDEVKTALVAAYRGSLLIYDNLGIVINSEEANKIFAEAYGRMPKDLMEISWARLKYAYRMIMRDEI